MNKKITSRAEDFSRWYLDVIEAADLAEHGPSKGSMIIKPYGYAIWELIQKKLDVEFKKKGVENVYFPMFIPESLLKKEAEHVEGFSPELAVVTHAGGKKLDEALVVRPTSETIIYDALSRWIDSYRDLPLTINQWANIVRWELRPRLFLRTTEFLWQEGHTAHETEKEADSYARDILDIYRKFSEEVMGMAVVAGQKSESEKFAGALKTYSIEAIMQDGKALQYATSHNLGQNFSKAFNVMFTDKQGENQYVWQTSWGLSTRSIGGLIMTHSDDTGLVLPPELAPIKAVVIPILTGGDEDRKTLEEAKKITEKLMVKVGRIELDVSEDSAGERFYKWERKGVPVRIEIGPRDVKEESVIAVRRDNGEKIKVSWNDLGEKLEKLLKDIQTNLHDKAKQMLVEKIVEIDGWDDFKKAIKDGKFVMAYWDGSVETEMKIKDETKATIRSAVPFGYTDKTGKCVYSGKESIRRVLFAKAY